MIESVLRVTAAEKGKYRVDWAIGMPESIEEKAWVGDVRTWKGKGEMSLKKIPDLFRSRATSDAELEELGCNLHAFLLEGLAGKARAAAMQEGLRTWLVLDDLDGVPWECILDEMKAPVFCVPNAPWARWIARKQQPKPLDGWPIRVLLVVAEVPGKDTLAAEWEAEAIEDVLWEHRRDFDLHVMPWSPSHGELRAEIGKFQPHILHVIGHGVDVGAEHAIAFPAKTGQKAWDWRVRDVAADFQPGKLPPPNLVVLNACRSAAGAGAKENPGGIRSVGQAFLQRGTSALVTMQGDISGEAARIFGQQFYEQLAAGVSVDVAAAHGRDEIRVQCPNEPRQMAFPMVTAAGPMDSCLLRPARPAIAIERVRETKEFAFVGERFIDREAERRAILARLAPERTPVERGMLVVMRGQEDAGKRFLATTIMELLTGRGIQVRRLAVHGRIAGLGAEGLSWQRVLVELRSGRLLPAPERPEWIEGPLDGEAFREFDFDLQELCSNPLQPPPPRPAPLGEINPRTLVWPAADALSETYIERVFGSFRSALIAAAATEPLLLGFDELTDYRMHLSEAPGRPQVAEPPWWPVFARYLFGPVARGEVPGVTIVLSMREAEWRSFQPPKLFGNRLLDVEVGAVPPEQFQRLARQLYRRLCPAHWHDAVKRPKLTGKLADLAEIVTTSWQVVDLWRALKSVFGTIEFPVPRETPFDLPSD